MPELRVMPFPQAFHWKIWVSSIFSIPIRCTYSWRTPCTVSEKDGVSQIALCLGSKSARTFQSHQGLVAWPSSWKSWKCLNEHLGLGLCVLSYIPRSETLVKSAGITSAFWSHTRQMLCFHIVSALVFLEIHPKFSQVDGTCKFNYDASVKAWRSLCCDRNTLRSISV